MLPLPLAATLTLESAAGPSADGLPPPDVPLRFFLSAAVAGLLAGATLTAAGAPALATRWSPAALATTHLLTLGVLVTIAFGAMFQVVPVLGGGGLPQARRVAKVVQPTLALGTLLLAAAFLGGWPQCFGWAVMALLVAFLTMGTTVAMALRRRRAPGLRPIRMALAALVVAIVLGATMALGSAWPELGWPVRQLTDRHAAWGILGFALLLIVGVGHQVVPMFHITAAYSAAATRFVPWLLLGGLCLAPVPLGPAEVIAPLLVVGAGLWHVATSLRLLARRRRRRADPTVLGWQLGLTAIGLGLLARLAGELLPADLGPARWLPAYELPVAVLLGYLGIGSIVFGMLAKIVPFLLFLHAQRVSLGNPAAAAQLPTMDHFLPTRAARALVAGHAVVGVLGTAAALWPRLTPAVGITMMVQFLVLLVLLRRARRAYTEAIRPAATAAKSAIG